MRRESEKKNVWISVLVLMLGVYNVSAEETMTAQGGTLAWHGFWTASCLTQSFVVPLGKQLTDISFYVDDDKSVINQNYFLSFALYSGDYGTDGNPVKVITIPQSQVLGWVHMGLDTPLPAGNYYMQLWSSSGSYSDHLCAQRYTGSVYAGGRAATGWKGGTLLATNQDFLASYTTIDIDATTAQGGESSWYGCGANSCITQSFVVPTNQQLTEISFYLKDDKTEPNDASYYVAFALYSGSYGTYNLVEYITIPQGNIASSGWIHMTLTTPQPSGAYYMQVWSNQAVYNSHLFGQLWTGSTYSDGQAAAYWAGGILLGSEKDFLSAFTTVNSLAGAYQIVEPNDGIASEYEAAYELQYYVNKMTGYKLPVLSEKDYSSGPMIAIGFNSYLPAGLRATDFGTLGSEEIVNKKLSDATYLLLGGGRPRGALYAVYEFLHGKGVRWYTPTYTKIPTIAYANLVTDCNFRYNPPLKMRSITAGNVKYGVDALPYSVANRLNTFNLFFSPGDRYGGGCPSGPDMHTWWRMIDNSVLEANPTWMAWVDNKRTVPAGTYWGLCLSNTDVRQYLRSQTLAYARTNPNSGDIWLSQNDGSDYCHCTACEAFYTAHGGAPSSLTVQLINELAADVAADSNLAGRRVKTLAYSWSSTPPTNMTINSNVTIMFCLPNDFVHPIGNDPACATMRSNLAGYQSLGGQYEVYLYLPYENYWWAGPYIYPNADNIQWASQHGLTDIHTCVSGQWGAYGSEYVDLKAWVYARKAWDPNANTTSLVEDFADGYYGNASTAVKNAIASINNNVFEGDDPTGDIITYNNSEVLPNYINPTKVRAINQSFADANAALVGDSNTVYRERLHYAWISYLFSDIWLGFERAGSIAQYTAKAGTNSWYPCDTTNAVNQSFVVPIGQQLTDISFYVHDEKSAINPGYYLALALYSGNYGTDNVVQVITLPQADVPSYGWVHMKLSTPQAAGNYYVVMWSNNTDYNNQLYGQIYTGSTYSGGRAAIGWNGTTLLPPNQDFLASFTTTANNWLVPMTNDAVHIGYPSKVIKFMADNGITTAGSSLALLTAVDKLDVNWPAEHLVNGNVDATVVPSIGGQIVDFKDNILNFSPLKHYWGGWMVSYPTYGSWWASVNWEDSRIWTKMSDVGARPVVMATQTDHYYFQNTVSLSGQNELQTILSAQALYAGTTATIRLTNLFDLDADVLGDIPTLYVEKSDGTWMSKLIGGPDDLSPNFFYCASNVDINNMTGRMILASQNQPKGVLITYTNPSEVGSIGYLYDRYAWPADWGHALEWNTTANPVALAQNEYAYLHYNLKNVLLGSSVPVPSNCATDVSVTPTLSWTAGQFTDLSNGHDVYLGMSLANVSNATRANPLGVLVSQGQTDTTYQVINALAPNTYFAWRVDEVGFGGKGITKSAIWYFITAPGQATSPTPLNSATGISMTPLLTWTAGSGTISHDVYFGTNQTNVTNATHASAEYKVNKSDPNYLPGILSVNTIYYWRIDEVGNGGTTKGATWSFTTTNSAPTFVNSGDITSNAAAITPALPASISSGDILLLFVETANQAVSISNQNGGTWTQVTYQGTGTAGSTTATRLTVFWSKYNGTQGAPTTSDSGDHQTGRIVAVRRGVAAYGTPWDVTGGGVESTSDSSGSIPGATTTVAKTLVVAADAASLPDSTGTANFSSWTNGNLTSLTERVDNTQNAGNGGAVGIATGVKATAGAYGNTSVTHASAAVKGMISIAIKP